MKINIAVLSKNSGFCQFVNKTITDFNFKTNSDLRISIFHTITDIKFKQTSINSFQIIMLDLSECNTEHLHLLLNFANQTRHTFFPISFICFSYDITSLLYFQEVHPFECFLAPYKSNKLQRSLQDYIQIVERNHMYINSIEQNGAHECISPVSITMIETVNARKRELIFYTVDQKYHHLKGYLSDWEPKLRFYAFLRANRNQLINVNFIKYFDSQNAYMLNGKLIPLSRTAQKLLHCDNNLIQVQKISNVKS